MADILQHSRTTAIILSKTHPDPFIDQASISPFALLTNLSNSIFT